MRFTFLAAMFLLALASPGRGEYDAGSTAPAKPGAVNGVAPNRPPQTIQLIVEGAGGFGDEIEIRLWKQPGKRIIIIRMPAPAAMPASKVKATHRPANIPSSRFIVPPFACVW